MRSTGLLPQDSPDAEEARVHAAYARRAAKASRYSCFDPGHLFIVQEIERRLLGALKRHGMAPLDHKKILEIGCGNGYWLREFIKWGASPENLTGVDLLADRLAQARRLSPRAVRFIKGNAAELQFADESFEIVLQATVFTSILDTALKRKVAAESMRVLRPGGIVLWYDFRVNNPRNPDVRGIKAAEIKELFPDCEIALESLTLLPPLVRRLARYVWLGCYLLSGVPWARTHYLGTIRKP